MAEATDQTPAWAATAGALEAARRGFRVAFSVPGFVLFATSIGFGALARDLDVTFIETLTLAAVIYATPAQVVLIDQLARGAALLTVAFSVSLTAVRLLPMTVTLMPLVRDDKRPLWLHLIAVHFCAITAWIEGHRRLPHLPKHLRLPFFVGLGAGLVVMTVSGSGVGHVLAGTLPGALSAALLFATPLYFLLSLLGNARVLADRLAVVLGALLGPAFYILVPGLDLFLAGVIGGTAGHFAARKWGRR